MDFWKIKKRNKGPKDMKSSEGEAEPWDPDSPGGDEVVAASSFENKLKDSWPFFTSHLGIKTLWPHLIKLRVVSIQNQDDIQRNGNQSRAEEVEGLLKHICRGPVWRFHAFLRALACTENYFFIKELGLRYSDYIDIPKTKLSVSVHCPVCREFYTKPYTLDTCGHTACADCITDRMPRSEDDKSLSITCPLPDCQKITIVKNEEEFSAKIDHHVDGICNILRNGGMSFDKIEKCRSCHSDIPSSTMLHHCQKCNIKLCMKCFFRHPHQFTAHKGHVVHNHSNLICCRHGHDAVQLCKTCDAFICGSCFDEHCKDHYCTDICDRGKLPEVLQTCNKLQPMYMKNVRKKKKVPTATLR